MSLDWAGDDAHERVKSLRRELRGGQIRISISYKVQKLSTLLPRYTTTKPGDDRVRLMRDLVYKYPCLCGKVYIGETLRRLDVRINEHAAEKSPLSQHIRDCPEAIEDAIKCAEERVHGMTTRSQAQNLPQPPPVAKLKPERFVPVARGLRGRESRKRYETFYIRHHERRGLAINVCTKSREMVLY